MPAVNILSHQHLDHRLSKEEVQGFNDDDLLQLIVFTDGVMSLRPLTSNEIHNFWLVFAERRARRSPA